MNILQMFPVKKTPTCICILGWCRKLCLIYVSISLGMICSLTAFWWASSSTRTRLWKTCSFKSPSTRMLSEPNTELSNSEQFKKVLVYSANVNMRAQTICPLFTTLFLTFGTHYLPNKATSALPVKILDYQMLHVLHITLPASVPWSLIVNLQVSIHNTHSGLTAIMPLSKPRQTQHAEREEGSAMSCKVVSPGKAMYFNIYAQARLGSNITNCC